MTREENLLYAGMVTGHLKMAGIKVRPIVDGNGNYTGEIDLTLDNGLHVLISVTGFYHKKDD